MKCAAPMKISVDWIWGQFVLEPEQLLATITPCGGFIFIQGVFKADGFKKLDAGFQVPVLVKGPCTVTLEVSLRSPMVKSTTVPIRNRPNSENESGTLVTSMV